MQDLDVLASAKVPNEFGSAAAASVTEGAQSFVVPATLPDALLDGSGSSVIAGRTDGQSFVVPATVPEAVHVPLPGLGSSAIPMFRLFMGIHLSELFVLEVCAGHAGLTAAMRRCGFNAIGIDSKRNAHITVAPVAVLDLTTPGGRTELLRLCNSDRLAFVWWAPPCGTASRAREKKIPSWLRAQGAPEPRPLRSTEYPTGVPGLTRNERARVDSANMIYSLVVETVHILIGRNILFAIENPSRSHMWSFPGFPHLAGTYLQVVFMACAHGGTRPKSTTIVTNAECLRCLAAQCPGGHIHEKWAPVWTGTGWKFPSAQESEYPKLLCDRISQAVSDYAILNGAVAKPSELLVAPADLPSLDRTKISAGRQPRGRAIPPLVPMYSSVVTRVFSEAQWKAMQACLAGAKLVKEFEDLPKGARLVRHNVLVGKEGSAPGQVHSAWGLPWDVPGFLSKALSLPHPSTIMSAVDHDEALEIIHLLRDGATAASRRMVNKLREWQALKLSLAEDEKRLHEGLPPAMQEVLKGKSLLLMKALFVQCGYEDSELFNDITKGADLTGSPAPSNVFPRRSNVVELPLCDLLATAAITRSHVTARASKPSDSPSSDAEVWSETMDEVQKKWLSGPYSAKQITEAVGDSSWPASRRFGLAQNGKLRVIDDYTIGEVNLTYAAQEKLSLRGLDGIVSISRALASAARPDGSLCVVDCTGFKHTGVLHPEFSVPESKQLVGRCLDLKSAYRQLALNPEQSRFSVVAVYCPQSKTAKFFLQHALPFGARSSVIFFNRFAKGLKCVGLRGLGLLWDQYFDDFPHVALKKVSAISKSASECFLNLLGVDFARDEKKRKDFAASFSALGALVDFSPLAELDRFHVCNKPDRVAQLDEIIRDIVRSKKLPRQVALSLRGKLIYADSNVFGKAIRSALAPISLRADSKNEVIAMSPDDLAAMAWIADKLHTAEPRRVFLADDLPPILIYTDGACEPSGDGDYPITTMGGVMFDPVTAETLHFGCHVPRFLVERWSSNGAQQLIAQAEMLPILVAKRLFADWLRHRNVVFYIDNDSAMFGCIKGLSPVEFSAAILRNIGEADLVSQSKSWYARVPTEANVADGPSRLDFAYVLEVLKSVAVRVRASDCLMV